MTTTRVSNSLDPDQARRFVGPDLGPNCLQMLSAEETSRQRLKSVYDLAQWKIIGHTCIKVQFLFDSNLSRLYLMILKKDESCVYYI